jgi:hypothetical protein
MDDALPAKAAPLAEQLVAVGAQLHLVLAHMEAWEADNGPRPDGATVPQILTELLETVLAPFARHRAGDAVATARVLAEVGAIIEGELLLVDRER